jgi:hypothetical protein
MKQIAMVVTVLMLGACAQMPIPMFVRDGATEKEFYMEQGQCEAQAYGVPRPLSGQIQAVFDACMRGKGWYVREVDFEKRDARSSLDNAAYSCSTRGDVQARGPQWLKCMKDQGWWPKN